MDKIRSSGFHIQAQKETHLTKDVVEQFYGEHKDKDFFGELTEFMTSGPTMFMVLSREDAISGMRDIAGPADPEEAKKSAPERFNSQYFQLGFVDYRLVWSESKCLNLRR